MEVFIKATRLVHPINKLFISYIYYLLTIYESGRSNEENNYRTRLPSFASLLLYVHISALLSFFFSLLFFSASVVEFFVDVHFYVHLPFRSKF